MQKIVPFLWFNDQAEPAMNFYTSAFQNAKITNLSRYGDAGPGPKGSVMMGTFELHGMEFYVLNGGPHFQFTPAISFHVSCTADEIDPLWQKISDGGQILMPLQKYPFSEKFGWLNDKFGISWQLNVANAAQKIMPFLMFVKEQCGKAEEAINFYMSLFPNSHIIDILRRGKEPGEIEGSVTRAAFALAGQHFMAMDSNAPHNFTFSGATSLFVNCETQAEIDTLWEKFLQGGTPQNCGWLKDKYGVFWQIIPTLLGKLLRDKEHKKSNAVMKAMMKMIKIDSKALQEAYDNA